MRHSGGNRHKQAPISKMNQLYNTVHLLSAVASAVIMTSCLPQLVYGGEFDGWSEGRATFYGEDGGATIHQGSCMFGQLDYSKGTGWDIAAISDKAHDYAGSCGRCYEVACRSAHIGDGHGNSLDRTGSCQGQKSVTVMITDTCPCYYPSNAHSNSRWCCGDQYHMDLSKRAFEKIATLGAGAIGVYYRVVECPGTSFSSSSSSSTASSSSSSSSDDSSSSSWGSATSSPSDQSSSSSSSSSSSADGNSWSSSSSDSSSSDWNPGDGSSSSSSSWSSSTSSSYDHGGAGDWLHDLLSVSAQYYDHNWPNRGGHLGGHWGGHRKTLAVRGV